jgi:hypothetical protein
VYDHADEVLDARVTTGPDIDGRTWQATGHCDADGIAKLAEENGQPVSAKDRKDIATLCRLVQMTNVVGADDHPPRELRLAAHIDKRSMAALAAPGGDASAGELDRLDLERDVKLTGWGADVAYTAPADTKPMDELGMAALGLLLQAAA